MPRKAYPTSDGKEIYLQIFAFSSIPAYFDSMFSARILFLRRFTLSLCLLLSGIAPFTNTFAAAPRDNPYDVLGRVFAPFWGVLIRGGRETHQENRALTMTLRMTAVSGRLSKDFQGAVLHAWVQFPDKLKLEAPVLGEEFTVCRNGDLVWATPGQKVEFLLSKFSKVGHGLPKDLPIPKTPLPLPLTEQQAAFLPALPALFTIKNPDVAEIAPLHGEDNRLITAGVMPELAKAIEAEDFVARLWVAAGYIPRRVEIARRDFACTVDITELTFTPNLPKSTWEIPAGITDVYRTNAHKMEAVLFVIMNSLQAKRGLVPVSSSPSPAQSLTSPSPSL